MPSHLVAPNFDAADQRWGVGDRWAGVFEIPKSGPLLFTSLTSSLLPVFLTRASQVVLTRGRSRWLICAPKVLPAQVCYRVSKTQILPNLEGVSATWSSPVSPLLKSSG